MHEFIRTLKIGGRLLYESLFYFFLSYSTVFISIFTIKVVEGIEYSNVFLKPEVIAAFLASIPTYLFGIYYTIQDNRKKMKEMLLLIIIISVALFGIIFNVKEIKDISTIQKTTYIMLLISLLFTFFFKVDIEEFKNNIATQKKADKSREKKQVTFPNGKNINL